MRTRDHRRRRRWRWRWRWRAAALLALAGCGARDQPYRFASPMLGMASVPPVPLAGEPPPQPLRNRDPLPHEEPAIRPARRVASAAAAAAIIEAPVATSRAELPMPHQLPADSLAPPPRSPDELRALVGRRDKRDPLAAALAWSRELGLQAEATTGSELVAWAEHHHRLRAASEVPVPGDLLVFDRTTSEDAFDLVAVVVARDARGVSELVYLGGGVVRRGFVDATRPALRRDADGAVVNTYLRHAKRYPPKGTRYLAGELLSHVVRAR